MSNLHQLVYASEASISSGGKGVDLEVGRILTKSKNNNSKVSIGGVLYYADGYFFQVLEGDKAAIHLLYDKICKDERHAHAKILLERSIDSPQFSDWTMHFVPAGSSIRQLLKDYGLKHFTPFIFSEALTVTLVEVLSLNGKYTPQGKTKSSPKGLFSSIKGLFK
ncbi:MAG: hypothetical protein ACI843_002208 [Psychrobacter glaciei]|jgi:hypothetical protein